MDLTPAFLLSIGLLLLLIGYILPFIHSKQIARTISWSVIVVCTYFSIQITANDSPLYRMLAIVSLQLLAMKTIVMVETYTTKPKLNLIQWLAFAQGWFGMRPTLFESLRSKPLPNVLPIFIKGFSRIIIGVFLLFISQYIDNQQFDLFFLSNLLMLIGLSLILHFGILNISTAMWRLLGVNVKELFVAPYKSKSLKEFWGRRWNSAFSEMTAIVAYKPLKGLLGKNSAMFFSFLLSGILHEIAISFPVNAGYGLPLLYFLIHGLIMLAEDKMVFLKKILEHGVLARLWVLGWLILPMPILFHQKFMTDVIIPLRNVILNIFPLAKLLIINVL